MTLWTAIKQLLRGTWEERAYILGFFALGFLVLVMLGSLLGQIVFEIRHPCLERGPKRTCVGVSSHCAFYDSNGSCLSWVTEEYAYDCTPCVRRDMR